MRGVFSVMATLIRFGTVKGRVALVWALLGAFHAGVGIVVLVALARALDETLKRQEIYESAR